MNLINEAIVPIRFENDGKKKWQSVTATIDIEIGGNSIYVVEYGKDNVEARCLVLEAFKELICPYLAVN